MSLDRAKKKPVMIFVFCAFIGNAVNAQTSAAANCDNGIVRMASGETGRVTVCPAINSQAPALARQLEELRKAVSDQSSQMAKLQSLVRSLNSVGRNLGVARQTQLLENISTRLTAAHNSGGSQLEARIANLAEDLEAMQEQMLAVLSNPATAPKASAALQGAVGDSLARLDFTTAHDQLEDIRLQLHQIHTTVDEVNAKATNIQNMMEASRISAANIESALVAADTGVLKLVSAPGTSTKVLEAILRKPTADGKATVGQRFLEVSIGSEDAMSWFDSQLSAGLDPELTLPGDSYKEEALLVKAMRAGNVAAMKILLRHGASPHAYQNLAQTPWPSPRFVFPISAIAADNRLTLKQKQELVAEFSRDGVIIPAVRHRGDYSSVMFEVNELSEKVPSIIATTLRPSPTLCEQLVTPVCRRATEREKEDWCGFVAKIPRSLTAVGLTGESRPIFNLELQYLLSVAHGRAYFLAFDPLPMRMDYVVVEVSKDGSSWIVERFSGRDSDLGGACDQVDAQYTPDYCWRRVSLHRVGGSDQVQSDVIPSWKWKLSNTTCSAATAGH